MTPLLKTFQQSTEISSVVPSFTQSTNNPQLLNRVLTVDNPRANKIYTFKVVVLGIFDEIRAYVDTTRLHFLNTTTHSSNNNATLNINFENLDTADDVLGFHYANVYVQLLEDGEHIYSNYVEFGVYNP